MASERICVRLIHPSRKVDEVFENVVKWDVIFNYGLPVHLMFQTSDGKTHWSNLPYHIEKVVEKSNGGI